MEREEVAAAIDRISGRYGDGIVWQDYGSKGSHRYNPDKVSHQEQAVEAAKILAEVTLEMPKGSEKHKKLAKKVAVQLSKKFITYHWLRDTTTSFLVELSRKTRKKTEGKGTTEIDSMEEVLR